MPDNQTGEHEEKRSAHIHEQQGAQPEHVSESWSPYADSPGYFQDLLGRNRLEGRGSANTRIEALNRAQKAYGNRAVQRFLAAQRAATDDLEEEDDAIAKRIEAKAGGGNGIDSSIKQRLESGIGTDLSGVRVHTDSEADGLARAVSSVAFTTGQDIFFRAGAYNPHTTEGMRLLAHEATHTVQQSAGPVAGTPSAGGVSISDPDDQFEQAAERVADLVASGGSVAPASPTPGQLQRRPEELLGIAPVQRMFMPDLSGLLDNMPSFDQTARGVGGAISGLGGSIGGAYGDAGGMVGSGIGAAGGLGGRILERGSSFWGGLGARAGQFAGDGVSSVGGMLGSSASRIGATLGTGVSGIESMLGLGSGIGAGITGGSADLGGMISGVSGAAGGLLSRGASEIGSLYSTAGAGLGNMVSGAGQFMGGNVTRNTRRMGDFGAGVTSDVGGFVSGMADWERPSLPDIFPQYFMG